MPIMNNDDHYNSVIKKFQMAAVRLCKRYLEFKPYINSINPEFCIDPYHNFLEN